MVPDVRYFFPDLCPSLRILSLAKPERPAGRFLGLKVVGTYSYSLVFFV